MARRSWGNHRAPRRALLVHGIESDSSTMWRFGQHLAACGWYVVAVDLPGHGGTGRADDYALPSLARALSRLALDGGAWHTVIGHSLGGALAPLAMRADPTWSRSLVLIDPALRVTGDDLDAMLAEKDLRAGRPLAVSEVMHLHPTWSPEDQHLKSQASRRALPSAVERILRDNRPWDVRGAVSNTTVPLHIISGDPHIFAMTHPQQLARLTEANNLASWSVIPGAGHSPHRERPMQTLAELDRFLHLLETEPHPR